MPHARSGGLFDEPSSNDNSSRVMVAHIDGGSRGNPGPAGYGAHITDGDGKLVAELSDYLGVQTNNFAEYSGLIAALEYAVAHGYDTVKVISDSELLVKQMKGQYKVRSEALQEIYQEARALVRKLDRFEIRHVLRHLNKDADRLANQAMDRGSKSRGGAGASSSAGRESPRELRGVVRKGVVEFNGEKFPEGVAVIVRRAR